MDGVTTPMRMDPTGPCSTSDVVYSRQAHSTHRGPNDDKQQEAEDLL